MCTVQTKALYMGFYIYIIEPIKLYRCRSSAKKEFYFTYLAVVFGFIFLPLKKNFHGVKKSLLYKMKESNVPGAPTHNIQLLVGLKLLSH